LSDWFDEALKLYKPGEFGYKQIAKKLGVSLGTVRSRFRDHKKRGGEVKPASSILADIIKGLPKKAIMEKHKISERVLKATAEDLVDEGYNIIDSGDSYSLCKIPEPSSNIIDCDWQGNDIIRFGVVSDCHLTSKYQQLTYLNQIYDIFWHEGLTKVYNAGDLTEGFKMRPGHEHEIFKHGADEQVDYVCENYPKRDGMDTEFILGNHDLSHMKNGGIDIGRQIAKRRPDMRYQGALNARVNLTPKCTMELNHPLDGSAYAISYSIQKMIDSYSGAAKPNILLNGHHHKLFYAFYRNVHGVECGTFQAQTPWMKGKRLAAHMGGLIITVHVDKEGSIKRFKPEFIPFYEEIKNDF
jgi:hypothetical protein